MPRYEDYPTKPYRDRALTLEDQADLILDNASRAEREAGYGRGLRKDHNILNKPRLRQVAKYELPIDYVTKRRRGNVSDD